MGESGVFRKLNLLHRIKCRKKHLLYKSFISAKQGFFEYMKQFLGICFSPQKCALDEALKSTHLEANTTHLVVGVG